ncbi:retrovirus-related Pol polyprotein from transposon 17.6 [Trichonephila clavipes]|nr:retrovirus-related Pol polyprotein from transposon 17.6 [Trichonephila clavipes]
MPNLHQSALLKQGEHEEMPVLKDKASLDIGCEKYAAPEMFTETQQKSKESAPLIQKIENGINNEVRDQEIAPMQLVPVRREIFSKLNVNRVGPLPIIPENKHILSGMSMSPRCHEAVPVPETASTPLVEAMLMAELPQGHEKFDLSYFDNVVVFSEGWDFPIDHMDGILELNTHLAVRLAKFELAQDDVEYCGHVVGLGKQSPAQLKARTMIDFSILRYKTQVKVLGYERQYIPMFSRLVTPVTETLKRKSKKGDIKWTSECPEFFRQLEGNLSTNSVLYAPDFTKRFIFQPETILFIFLYADHKL